MSIETGFYGLLVLMLLLALRVPVALALMVVSLGGLSLMLGWETALSLLASTPYDFIARIPNKPGVMPESAQVAVKFSK